MTMRKNCFTCLRFSDYDSAFFVCLRISIMLLTCNDRITKYTFHSQDFTLCIVISLPRKDRKCQDKYFILKPILYKRIKPLRGPASRNVGKF